MIREMVEAECKKRNLEPQAYSFTRKDIRSWSKWSDFQVKCHVWQLEDLEYLYSVAGKKGRQYVYELLYAGGGEDGKPFLMGLTSIEELKRKSGQPSKPNSANLEGNKGYLEGARRAVGGQKLGARQLRKKP
jgi:hypothetical protein